MNKKEWQACLTWLRMHGVQGTGGETWINISGHGEWAMHLMGDAVWITSFGTIKSTAITTFEDFKDEMETLSILVKADLALWISDDHEVSCNRHVGSDESN